LVAVAKAVGVSHQAVSYHFKTREQLLQVTTMRALDAIYRDVLASIGSTLADPQEVVLRLLTALRDDGHARVLASLLLQPTPLPETTWAGAMVQLKEGFTRALENEPGRRGTAAQSLELVLNFVLGQAIFGRHLRHTLQLEDSPERDTEMAMWLTGLLQDPTSAESSTSASALEGGK
jgi:AcrR family transcriptional regulator